MLSSDIFRVTKPVYLNPPNKGWRSVASVAGMNQLLCKRDGQWVNVATSVNINAANKDVFVNI